ncbi:MAG TPA: hypothetical protein VG122_16055 [Gemmata sp.]|jgi:hypothetical protein|nr:hypothetical protein [Gemmata sp.]
MTHLHRLVVATVLIAGSVTATARAAEPDKLLPATTEGVLQVNVRQILDSDIAKKYALEQLKQVLDGQDAKKLLADIGLDPLKDIDQLVIGTSGSNKGDVKYLMILHGKFTPDKLYLAAEAQAKKDPDKFSMIKEGNTIFFKYQPDSDTPVYGTVVDEKTVIASSDKKLITNALTAAKNNQAATLNKDLVALLKKMDDKASVYAAGVVKGKFDELQIPGGGNLPVDLSAFQNLLPKIETMAVSVNVKADVHIEMTLGMKDDDAAGDFRSAFDDLLKQIKPLAQIFGAAEPRAKPLGDILGTIKSTTRNKDVVITGKVTGANIGKMVNPND